LLELLASNKAMTREQLAETIGVSDNAIKQHRANLQKEGILIREGGRKIGWCRGGK
jgi:predicted ArsR family transcriptional regulator